MSKPEYFVGYEIRKVDERYRINLPHYYKLLVGDNIYYEKSKEGIKCYDEITFKGKAKKFNHNSFKKYNCTHVDLHHRAIFNGNFVRGIEVIIEGHGKFFVVRKK